MIFAVASGAAGEAGSRIAAPPVHAIPLKLEACGKAAKETLPVSGAIVTVNQPAFSAIQVLASQKQSIALSTQLRRKAGGAGRAATTKREDRIGTIRPALLRLNNSIAVPLCDHSNQPFNLVARRSGQPSRPRAEPRSPTNDIRQGHEYARTSVVPVKIPSKVQDLAPRVNPRPIDASFAFDMVPDGKPGSWRPDWQPPGFQKQYDDLISSLERQPDSRSQPSPAKAPNEHRAGLAPLLIVAFLLGVVGTALVPVVSGKIATLATAHFRGGGNLTDIGWTSDPLALPRMHRDNRLFSYLDFIVNRATKQPYVNDREPMSGVAGEADLTAESDALDAAAAVEDQTPPDGEAITAGPETPVEGGVRSLPSLYFDPATGKQVIGNFATRSFPGDHVACTEIAQAMLLDARASQDALYTLADTQAIKVMRFCAANGSVITTCRNGRITISPRRPRPNDGCGGRGTL